jgi:hypothetical protein
VEPRNTPDTSTRKLSRKVEFITAGCALLLIVAVCFVLALIGSHQKKSNTNVPSKPVSPSRSDEAK